ncbi:hypothetical protein CROQUDRAFT_131141 [Cronartium quercuum f. sp. fusiforme G11]|uniref:CUE domain-containing protein n=1 Tax=Cronartium quercuum f. sp. fusiforme G11 TaxID=708437 RepID=A0A9P6TEP3_9BASI|nr:hypothetical protein CROQUDRAFT_131141 [Cronartium quercuum f. sp. fusiforme G11]
MLKPTISNDPKLSNPINLPNETRSKHSSPSSIYSDSSNHPTSTLINFEKSPSLEDYLNPTDHPNSPIKPIQATLIHHQIDRSNQDENLLLLFPKSTFNQTKSHPSHPKMKSISSDHSNSNSNLINKPTIFSSSLKSPPSPSHSSISPPSSAGLIEHDEIQDPSFLRTDQYKHSLSSNSSHSDDQELVSLYSKYQNNHSSSIHLNNLNQPFEDISTTSHHNLLDLPSSISSSTSTSSIYSNEIHSTKVFNELKEMLGEAIDSVHDTFNSSSDHQTLVEEVDTKDKVIQSESYSSLLSTIKKSIAAKRAQNGLNKQQVLSIDRKSSTSFSNYSQEKSILNDKEEEGDEIADQLTPLPLNLSPSNSAETNINQSTLPTTTNNPQSITNEEQTLEIISRPSPPSPTHPSTRSPPLTTNLQSPGAPKPISTYPQLITRQKSHTPTKVSSPLKHPSIILQSSPDKSSHNIHEHPSPRSNLPHRSRTTSSSIGRSSSELSNLQNWQWLDSNTGTPKPNQLVNNLNELTKNERILKKLNDYYKSTHNENELDFKISLLNQRQMNTKSLKNKNLNINIKEFKKIKSTAERCKIYSSKINEMWQVQTGIDVWLFYKTSNEDINLDNNNQGPVIRKLSYQSQPPPQPPSPIPQHILNEGSHSRDTSSSSVLSFPARSDATRAIEITERSGLVEIVNTSNTFLPNPLMAVHGLLFPGLYQPNGGSGSTNPQPHNHDAPDFSSYSLTNNNNNNPNLGTSRNLVTNNYNHNKPSTLSFLSQLKRKNSNRKHINLTNLNNNHNHNIVSKEIKSKISSPILSNHHHNYQRKPNGARKPNQSISNNLISTSTPPHEIIKNNQNKAIFKDNKFNRSSLGFNNTSNHNNHNFDNLKINKILDILPFANKKRLEEILVRENGDDVATISAYLEEERKNV